MSRVVVGEGAGECADGKNLDQALILIAVSGRASQLSVQR